MDLQDMKTALRENGYKNTPQRDEVFLALKKHAGEHLSPDEIHTVLRRKNNHIGVATIYRTLQIFESIGIVHKLDFDDGVYRYELADEDEAHRHHHLICKECEKIIELRYDILDKLSETVYQRHGFTVNDHSIKIFGTCSDCKEKTGGNFEKKKRS